MGFSFPLFALAAEVARARGLLDALIIFVAGCFLVFALAIPTSVIGSRRGVSTYVILQETFGSVGGKFCNVLLAISLLGWFSTVADLLGSSIATTMLNVYGLRVSSFLCSTLCIIPMTLTAIFGFKVVERFATIMVPTLSVFMLYVLTRSLSHGNLRAALAQAGDGTISQSGCLSAVVGAVILTAVLAPDYARYARSDRAAVVGVSAIGAGYPLIMGLSAIPAALFGRGDFMQIVGDLQMPGLALVLLVAATWTSNTANLYSTTLTAATIMPNTQTWRFGAAAAVIAIAAAYLKVSAYFVSFLTVLGAAMVPVAAVYVCDGFFGSAQRLAKPDRFHFANLLSLAIGATVGLVSYWRGAILSPMPSVDSLLSATASWLVLTGCQRISDRRSSKSSNQ
jgi:cytosine permease